MANSVFTVNGAGSGAWVPLATAIASNSASLAFTNIFSSSYYQYIFLFNSILPGTNNVILYAQLGTGAGPTYITTAYNWNLNSFVAGSFNSGNAVTSDTQGLVSNQSGTYGINSTDGFMSGQMILSGPNGGSNPAMATVYTGHKSAGGTPYTCTNTGNWYQAAAVFTAIKFYFSSGNVASGIIDVYGILPG